MLLTRLLQAFSSRAGRIGGGFAALTALAVFLWPAKTWTFDAGKFSAFATAMIVWFWSELSSAGIPHPNDVALFNKFLETINPSERRRLAEHDMGDSFPVKAFDGCGEIVETWKGPAFEFQDRGLNREWLTVRSALEDLVDKVNRYTGPVPGNQSLATVKTHQDIINGNRSPLTLKRTAELNDSAALASRRLDEFERGARAKLRV